MRQFDKRERVYIVLVIVLTVILFAKSLLIDGYKPKNEEEIVFKAYIEKVLEKRYDNTVYDTVFFTYKIVGIGKVSETEARIVEHYDSEKKEKVSYELRGSYKAKVRKYFFGVLPIGQDTIRITDDQ